MHLGLNILLQQSSMFSLCFFLPPLVKALFHYLYSWRKSPYEAPIASYPKNDVDRITKLLYHGYLEQDEKVFTLFLLCQFIFFRLYRKCIEHFSIVNNRFFYKFNISCFRIILFRCSFKNISPFYHYNSFFAAFSCVKLTLLIYICFSQNATASSSQPSAAVPVPIPNPCPSPGYL